MKKPVEIPLSLVRVGMVLEPPLEGGRNPYSQFTVVAIRERKVLDSATTRYIEYHVMRPYVLDQSTSYETRVESFMISRSLWKDAPTDTRWRENDHHRYTVLDMPNMDCQSNRCIRAEEGHPSMVNELRKLPQSKNHYQWRCSECNSWHPMTDPVLD